MRLAVVGSRSFNNRELFLEEISLFNPQLIVTGDATGADEFARRYAEEHRIELKVHHANWKRYKRAAGHIRNEFIVQDADVILAFWDGVSPGTKNSIDWCRKLNKPCKVIMF